MSASLFSPGGLWRASTWADRGLVLLLLVGSVLLGVAPRGAGASLAVVTVGRTVVARLPLDHAATYPIDGLRGPVLLQVEGGAVRVLESRCPHGICRAMGARDRSGGMIACVPNALLIRLEGGAVDPDAPDSVSR